MPIQQHPLPQDISSYRFRLIGDMTVRQFLYIAGFIILTILLHNSPIPFFFRYPLEVLTLGLGIGLAFVPVQGRPLDQWIIAFIKSIYSPTQFIWQQHKQEEITKTATKKANLPAQVLPEQNLGVATSTTTLDLTPPSGHSEPAEESRLPKATASSNASARSFTRVQDDEGMKTQDSKKKEKIREDQPITTPKTPPVIPSKPSLPNPSEASSVGGPPTANLPIPFTPDQPNTIVGLTLNPGGLILDGVLIEIISNGLTTRATRSNKLGQFLFAKSLENGLYQVKAEKEGFNFTTYSINLEGKIIKPLKIQAQTWATP